jgi:hypothetical protein
MSIRVSNLRRPVAEAAQHLLASPTCSRAVPDLLVLGPQCSTPFGVTALFDWIMDSNHDELIQSQVQRAVCLAVAIAVEPDSSV